MNLCGGIVNVSETEQLLLEIPDEKFQMTPRRKAASSTPSRFRKGGLSGIDTDRTTPSERRSSRPSSTRSRSSSTAAPSPTFLNPLSKDEVKKSRQRSSAPMSRSSKTSSVAVRQLEKGYKTTLLNAVGERRSVFLDVNPDKTCLRLRHFSANTSDSENDGTNSNYTEIRLKVLDITRLEVGREKNSKKGNTLNRPVRSFTIVMRRKIADTVTFNFEAESPTERDSIIGGIKGVLETTKASANLQRRSRSSSKGRSRSTRDKKNSERRNSQQASSARRPDYFDFEISPDDPDVAIEAEVRQDSNERSSDEDREQSSSSDWEGDRSGSSRELAITVVEKSSHSEGRAVEVAGSTWTFDDLLCGIATGGQSTSRGRVTTPRKPPTTPTEKALQEMKDEYQIDEGIGWDSLPGCNNTGALATVDDVEMELAAMANDVSATPFCTDDVCTASLKDFTDTMKGIFEMKQNSRENKPTDEKGRAMAEDYISGVLGAPTAVANLLSVKDMWPSAQKPDIIKKRVLQNRSRSVGAQAAHFNQLRKRMTFVVSDTVEKMPLVQLVSSYDDVERSGRFLKKLLAKDIRKPPRNDSTQFLTNVVQDLEQKSLPASNPEEELVFYDSDPEDLRESALKRGPRRAVAVRKNKTPRSTPRREALADVPPSKISLSRRLRRGGDDDYVAGIIETIKNEKMTLLWHPAQTKEQPNRVPFCSKVWIESGIYLIDGTFLLPKLTWVPISEDTIESKVLNITLSNPGTIDLLDVCRVRECTKVDRSVHPYANMDHSFIVQTQKEIQLFEAQSKQERTRIVNGLRLLIARLASLLMLRDVRAVDEFFGGNSVPGEAPTWAQGVNDRPVDAKPVL